MLLAINSYVGYAAKPGLIRYLPILGFFICGLLSKPMVVTFPVTPAASGLLAAERLDSKTAWPKQRSGFADGKGSVVRMRRPFNGNCLYRPAQGRSSSLTDGCPPAASSCQCTCFLLRLFKRHDCALPACSLLPFAAGYSFNRGLDCRR